jgi:hypothetical protein
MTDWTWRTRTDLDGEKSRIDRETASHCKAQAEVKQHRIAELHGWPFIRAVVADTPLLALLGLEETICFSEELLGEKGLRFDVSRRPTRLEGHDTIFDDGVVPSSPRYKHHRYDPTIRDVTIPKTLGFGITFASLVSIAFGWRHK